MKIRILTIVLLMTLLICCTSINRNQEIKKVVADSLIVYIDNMEKERTLLCHIDNTPCKDSAWVNRQKNAGVADSLSNRDILKLRKKMEQTQKDYVSVITIIAEKIEIIEEKTM